MAWISPQAFFSYSLKILRPKSSGSCTSLSQTPPRARLSCVPPPPHRIPSLLPSLLRHHSARRSSPRSAAALPSPSPPLHPHLLPWYYSYSPPLLLTPRAAVGDWAWLASSKSRSRRTIPSIPANRPANRASSKRNRSPEYHRPAAMAEEAKHLETARADRSVWLMKCPTVVSRAWQETAAAAASSSSEAGGANPNPNPNPVVAKVVLSLDPLRSDDQSLQFKMEMAQTGNGNTPKSYSLNMFKDFVPMCVFSESNQEKLACEGKVEHKFDMEPHRENLVDYGKLCRERTKKSMVKTRKVQVLENDHGMGMRPMPGMVGLVPSGPKEKKKPIPAKPSDMKRTRRDRRELENILFKLFEKQPNWSLKQLMQETDQPEQFLKEILNDLCVYNKRGPNQGTHELKPEYKKSTEDTDAT